MESLPISDKTKSEGWTVTQEGPVVHVRCEDSFDHQRSKDVTLASIEDRWGMVIVSQEEVIVRINPYQTELIGKMIRRSGKMIVEWIYRAEVAPECDCEDVHTIREEIDPRPVEEFIDLGGELISETL